MQTTTELLPPDAEGASWLTESEILNIQQELTWLFEVLQVSKPAKVPHPETGPGSKKQRTTQPFYLDVPATQRDQTLRKIESLNQQIGMLYAHLSQQAITPVTIAPGKPAISVLPPLMEANLGRFYNYISREDFQAATLRLALTIESMMASRSNPMQVPQLNLRFSTNQVGTRQREIRARRMDSNKIALECNPNVNPADWLNNLSLQEMRAIEAFAQTLSRSKDQPELDR